MLSPAAARVCSQHYGGWQAKINGRHRCPIRDQCITNKSTHTEQELQAWRDACNQSAEKWLQEQEMQR